MPKIEALHVHAWALLALAASPVNHATAQATVSPDQEYAKYVGRANAIEPQSNFGEKVNVRDGSFLIRTTNIEPTGTDWLIRLPRAFKLNIAGPAFETARGAANE